MSVEWRFNTYQLTLKDPGGGVGGNPPIDQEIACHFSQDHAIVTKILEFISINIPSISW